MFLRTAAVVVGLLELLAPRRVVDFWMRLATVGGRDVELRSWVYAAARIEGLALLAWGLRGRGRRADESRGGAETEIEVES